MAFNAPTPAFGATSTPFGASSTAAKPLFGQSTISFGTPQASSSTFGLGSTTTTSATGFGFTATPAANTTSLGGGFGSFSTTVTTASGFGSAFGSFNTTTTSATPSFGFGSTTTTTSQPLFSGFGQNTLSSTTTGFGGFGSFGPKPAAPAPSFGAFGQTTTQPTTFGQPQAQPAAQPNPLEAISKSIFQVNIYNDERDQILSCWNLLQARWGFGKGYYDPTQPPAEYTPENPLCLFKSIGYSRKMGAEPKDGIVALVFKKKEAEIKNGESQLVTSINNILGNKPNLTLHIGTIKAMSDEKTLVLIYLQERAANGMTKRVVNTEVADFLRTQGPSQTLAGMGVENVYCFQGPDPDTIKEYLNTPPSGIDPRLWTQAQQDNPNPDKLLPVPIIGFSDIRWRAKCQETETKVHHAVLDKIASEISELKQKNNETITKVAECKQRILDLEHRILKVLVRQEATRNVGITLRPEEEALRSQLESLHSQVNTPAQFKGRLNELLSLMRMQRQESGATGPLERYSMDPDAQEEIHQFLVEQHYAMQQVVQTVNTDIKDLKTMQEGIASLLRDPARS